MWWHLWNCWRIIAKSKLSNVLKHGGTYLRNKVRYIDTYIHRYRDCEGCSVGLTQARPNNTNAMHVYLCANTIWIVSAGKLATHDNCVVYCSIGTQVGDNDHGKTANYLSNVPHCTCCHICIKHHCTKCSIKGSSKLVALNDSCRPMNTTIDNNSTIVGCCYNKLCNSYTCLTFIVNTLKLLKLNPVLQPQLHL